MRTQLVRLRRRFAGALIFAGAGLLAACDGTRPFALEPENAPVLAPVSSRPSHSVGLIPQVSYTELPAVQDVGSPASAGSGMNQHGWVAGSTMGYFGGLSVARTRATLWTPEGARELGVLGQGHSSQHSWAVDVNDAGIVAGYTTGVTATGACCTAMTAFVWTENDGMVALPRLAEGKASSGHGINQAGHVAGVAQDASGVQHAVVWKGVGQAPVDLGTLGGAWAQAIALNDAGQVVGSVAGGPTPGAFLWTEGSGVQLLGTLGGDWAQALAVNEGGHVVGFSTLPDDSQHPFLWTPQGGMRDLGLPPGAAHAQARDINEAGHIAVTATLPDDGYGIIPTRAYLWVEGEWIDLGGDLGWSGVTALNDNGQVGGYALAAATAANGAARWGVMLTRPSTYEFVGFFAPIENLPAVNRVKAGSGVPVKFSLGGDHGLDILAAGYPASQPIACDAGAPVAMVEETATAGGSSLSFDPVTGQYTYIWKTARSWAGSCRRLTVRLADGTERSADFTFTR